MKKILSIFLVVFVLSSLVGCNKPECQHVDEDGNNVYDLCYLKLESSECTEHVDENNDNICDKCQEELEDVNPSVSIKDNFDCITISEAIKLALTQNKEATVIIMGQASRYIISPTQVMLDDVNAIASVIKSSMNAKEVTVNGEKLKNIVIFIVNKVNDIPSWFYLDNPNVKTIVIGLSLNMDGTSGDRVEKTYMFAEELKKFTDAKIDFLDERLTSVSAEKILISADVSRKKRKEVLDKLSATIILQDYLDQNNRKF